MGRLFRAGAIAAALVLAVYASGCSSVHTRTYALETDRIAAGNSLNIVHLSDLHSTIHGKNQETLISKIRELKPDLILLTGDIVDDVAPVTGTRLLLAGIKDTAPMYYVTGNHEYMSGNIAGIRRELESFGVVILSDKLVRIRVAGLSGGPCDLVIAGLDDPYKEKYETPGYDQGKAMRDAFDGLDESPGYRILLAHRPERIESYKQYPFDLVLSGHSHGGQVRIPPIINGLYAPNQGFFPRYAGGLYRHGALVHIISRGLSVNMIPRIFNPPELVFIRVTGM
jgi:predicted MPP superfamily phosphohydrolase